MGNTYILSNTLDLIEAITDNCTCDKEGKKTCNSCNFCSVPNYVEMKDDNDDEDDRSMKPRKLIRNPQTKHKGNNKKTKMIPPPIQIQSSLTYNSDSSSLDRVIATIEPYSFPPSPSRSIGSISPPGFGSSSNSNCGSSASSNTICSPLSVISDIRYNGKHHYIHHSTPNSSTGSGSNFSTVDMNTSKESHGGEGIQDGDGESVGDTINEFNDSSESSDYQCISHDDDYKKDIQLGVIKRNTFFISRSYNDHDENEIVITRNYKGSDGIVKHQRSHSSSYMTDIPEEDVVEIKKKQKYLSIEKQNSIVPNVCYIMIVMFVVVCICCSISFFPLCTMNKIYCTKYNYFM